MRVVQLNDRAEAGVDRNLDADQGSDPVRVRCALPLHIIPSE